jgi:hypothetical protein
VLLSVGGRKQVEERRLVDMDKSTQKQINVDGMVSQKKMKGKLAQRLILPTLTFSPCMTQSEIETMLLVQDNTEEV